MSNITKEWLLKTIAELEEERDATPGAVNEDAANALAAMKLAMASLEAEPVVFRSKLKPPSAIGSENWDYTDHRQPDAFELESCVIERLYTAPPAPVSDSLMTELLAIAKKAADAADECAHAEWSDDSMEHSTAIADWERRAAMLQGADEKAELTVWYGSMPESNGKANWTAILHRKGEGPCMDGFTIDRSEYPGRVLYAADRVRYLIGEKSERPSILDYDADAHSGYVKPGNYPVITDGWVACSERLPPEGYEPDGGAVCYLVWHKNEVDCGPQYSISNVFFLRKHWEKNFTHWMSLPAAPKQEVK